MREHYSQQTQGLLSCNRNIIKCLNNDPNLLIDSIDCLLFKELLPDELFEYFTNTKYDLVDLSVTQHLNEGFLEVFEHHWIVLLGLVLGQ